MIGDILLIDLFVRPCSFNLQEIVIQNDSTDSFDEGDKLAFIAFFFCESSIIYVDHAFDW